MWRPGEGPCSLSAVLAMDMTTHTSGKLESLLSVKDVTVGSIFINFQILKLNFSQFEL